MRDGLKLLGHVAAHALGVALGRDKLGMCGLKREELLQMTVKLGIRHLGRVERIVAICRMVEDAIELSSSLSWGLFGFGRLLRRWSGFRRTVKEVTEERGLLSYLHVCHERLPSRCLHGNFTALCLV